MVNKIIADYLKTNKRLVVPQFGDRKRGEQTGLDTLVVHAVNDEY